MFVADNDIVVNNSGIQIIDENSYFPLLQKKVSQSKAAKKISIPSFSKNSVLVESVETEKQGIISINELSRLYSKCNKSNTEIFYFTDEYTDEEYLSYSYDKSEELEDNEENVDDINFNQEDGQQIRNLHNGAVCCSMYYKFFNLFLYLRITLLF